MLRPTRPLPAEPVEPDGAAGSDSCSHACLDATPMLSPRQRRMQLLPGVLFAVAAVVAPLTSGFAQPPTDPDAGAPAAPPTVKTEPATEEMLAAVEKLKTLVEQDERLAGIEVTGALKGVEGGDNEIVLLGAYIFDDQKTLLKQLADAQFKPFTFNPADLKRPALTDDELQTWLAKRVAREDGLTPLNITSAVASTDGDEPVLKVGGEYYFRRQARDLNGFLKRAFADYKPDTAAMVHVAFPEGKLVERLNALIAERNSREELSDFSGVQVTSASSRQKGDSYEYTFQGNCWFDSQKKRLPQLAAGLPDFGEYEFYATGLQRSAPPADKVVKFLGKFIEQSENERERNRQSPEFRNVVITGVQERDDAGKPVLILQGTHAYTDPGDLQRLRTFAESHFPDVTIDIAGMQLVPDDNYRLVEELNRKLAGQDGLDGVRITGLSTGNQNEGAQYAFRGRIAFPQQKARLKQFAEAQTDYTFDPSRMTVVGLAPESLALLLEDIRKTVDSRLSLAGVTIADVRYARDDSGQIDYGNLDLTGFAPTEDMKAYASEFIENYVLERRYGAVSDCQCKDRYQRPEEKRAARVNVSFQPQPDEGSSVTRPGPPICVGDSANWTIVEPNSTLAEAAFLDGLNSWREQEYQAAIPQFEKAIQLSPVNYQYRYWLAVARLEVGDEELAYRQLKPWAAWLQLDPQRSAYESVLRHIEPVQGTVRLRLHALEQRAREESSTGQTLSR